VSNQIADEWLRASELLLLGTDVKGVLNVYSIVTNNVRKFVSYDLVEGREYLGPSIRKSDFSSDFVEAALSKESDVLKLTTVNSIIVNTEYALIAEILCTGIDEIRFRMGDGKETVLSRLGAAYPYSLVLAG